MNQKPFFEGVVGTYILNFDNLRPRLERPVAYLLVIFMACLKVQLVILMLFIMLTNQNLIQIPQVIQGKIFLGD